MVVCGVVVEQGIAGTVRRLFYRSLGSGVVLGVTRLGLSAFKANAKHPHHSGAYGAGVLGA